MYRLYDYPPSGNGYKVRLLLSHLGMPFEYVSLDILKDETRCWSLSRGSTWPSLTPFCFTWPKAPPSGPPTR